MNASHLLSVVLNFLTPHILFSHKVDKFILRNVVTGASFYQCDYLSKEVRTDKCGFNR